MPRFTTTECSFGPHRRTTAYTKSIAEVLLKATSLTQRIVARVRLNELVAQRVREGRDPVRVLAGVKAAVTRIAKRKGLQLSKLISFPNVSRNGSSGQVTHLHPRLRCKRRA